MPTYKNYKKDFCEKNFMRCFMCGFGGRTCVFGCAAYCPVRTADAVSMKAEESATVAQTIAEEGAVLGAAQANIRNPRA